MNTIIKQIKILILLAVIISSSVYSSENVEKKTSVEHRRTLLIFLKLPFVSISSTNGIIYNLIPFGFELPVASQVGFEVDSVLAFKDPYVGYFSLNFGLPVYIRKVENQKPYGGAYISPLFGISHIILNNTFDYAVGAKIGYVSNFESRLNLSGGFGAGYAFGANKFSYFIDLSIGYWL